MATEHLTITTEERQLLERVLDTLLPPEGSFPSPSSCGVIDGFILPRIAEAGDDPRVYPGIGMKDLRRIVEVVGAHDDVESGLRELEDEDPETFGALWALAVYGYYSRPEVVAAIQQDLAPGYHGAPLPRGYEHLLTSWDGSDPLQHPAMPRGSWIATEDVQRIELSGG